MCVGEITVEDIAKVFNATANEELVWFEGQKLAARGSRKIAQTIVRSAEALRRQWVKEAMPSILLQPERLFDAVQELDWKGKWYAPISEAWVEYTRPVLLGSTKATFSQGGLRPVEKDDDEVIIWGAEEKQAEVLRWVETRGANFITDISSSTQKAIEQTIDAALRSNMDVRGITRLVSKIIGLSPRDARALANRQTLLVKQGKTAAQIERTLKAYRKRLLRQRGETIARTELMTARNTGTLNAWRRAQEQRLLPSTVQKELVMGPNACQVCQDIVKNGPVDLNAMFVSDIGVHQAPPIHPRCRCSMSITHSV